MLGLHRRKFDQHVSFKRPFDKTMSGGSIHFMCHEMAGRQNAHLIFVIITSIEQNISFEGILFLVPMLFPQLGFPTILHSHCLISYLAESWCPGLGIVSSGCYVREPQQQRRGWKTGYEFAVDDTFVLLQNSTYLVSINAKKIIF